MLEPKGKISIGNTNRSCLKGKKRVEDVHVHQYVRHLKAVCKVLGSRKTNQKIRIGDLVVVVVHAFNSSTQEAGVVGGSLEFGDSVVYRE